MKISIIIPVYNGENYISKCIDSIINQTYKNIEIVIVNDGSTDKSEQIVESYKEIDERIILINQKNSGVSTARNNGMSIATGDYISFVDSDDWVEDTFIERMVHIADEKGVDVVRCNYIKEYQDRSERAQLYDLSNKLLLKKDFYTSSIFDHFLYNKNDIPNYVMLLLIKRKIIKDKIMFDNSLYMMEDVLFYQQLFYEINSVYFLDEPLYHYNSFGISATRDVEKVEKNIYGIMNSVDKIKKFLSKKELFYDIKAVNSCQINLIVNYLQKINLENNSFKVRNILKKLYKNKHFLELLSKYDKKSLNFYRNILLLFMKFRNVNVVIFIMKLKKMKGKKHEKN